MSSRKDDSLACGGGGTGGGQPGGREQEPVERGGPDPADDWRDFERPTRGGGDVGGSITGLDSALPGKDDTDEEDERGDVYR